MTGHDHRALRRRFEEQGFVHLPGFLAPPEVAAMIAAVTETAAGQTEPNELTLDGMRFASNLYRDSAALRRALCAPALLEVATAVFASDLWVRWDQAVWKAPGAPAFPWHQDNGYTDLPVTHLQAWFALTASRPENGGLLVAPGRHRQRLAHRWVGDHVDAGEPDEVVPLPAAPGDLVLFSSLLPHSTPPNTTDEVRLAYVAEYLPLAAPDRSVTGPHLVASRRGVPVGGLVDLTSTWPALPDAAT